MKLVVSLLITLFLCSCSTSTQQSSAKAIDLVPSSSVMVFQSENLANAADFFTENSFFKANSDLAFFKEIEEEIEFFKGFKTASSGVICFSAIGKKNIATSFIASSEDVDFNELSSTVSNRKSFTYEGKEVNEFKWKEKSLYAVWFDQNIMVSNSKLIIENKIRDIANAIPADEAFKSALKTTDSSTPSIYIQTEDFKNLYNKAFAEHTYLLFSNITDWVGFDLKLDTDEIKLSGVGVSQENADKKLDLLKNQERLKHQIATVVSLNAIGFESYAIPDFEMYLEQRKKLGYSYNNTNANFFEAINEVGKIHYTQEDLVVLKSSNAAEAFASLQPIIQSQKNFRDFEIYTVLNAEMLQIYAPLIVLKQANFVTQIGDFFVFAKHVEALENCIINYLNQANLALQANYKTLENKLSNSSNVLMFALSENWLAHMQTKSHASFKDKVSNLDLKNYHGVGLQINVDEKFTYVNAVMLSTPQNKNSSLVKQVNRFKLIENSLIHPEFFTNWRTQQRDVFLQDEQLQLQLLDAEGKLIWNKSLSEVVLSPVTEFDIFQNTRLQLAFATEHKIHVIDKNGKDVSPFPIQLKEKITQPLQIFDYDNNGKHRFMICQGNRLKAYNKEGKLVKGFDFKTDNSDISRPPKHIRIGKKDYVLVQESSGKLHVLDRTGKERVSYETDAEFSGNPWFLYDGQFTSTTKDGNVVQITEAGDVQITEKDLLSNHFINASGRLLVTLSENILQINDVEIELDYGLYTSPQLIQNQDKTWVTLTDTQAKKLYVFDEFGNLLNGFPVYANSKASYYSLETNKVKLMVEGEENAILLYEIN